MFYLKDEKKQKKKNKTNPSKSDIDLADKENLFLADKWRAYSKEVRIHIYVSDLHEMTRFYNQILEFPIVKRHKHGNSTGVLLNIGGNIIELFNKTNDNYYNKNFNGNISFSLRVNDIKKTYDDFLKKNIKISELINNDWGDTSFTIIDPEGNRIILFSLDQDYNKYYKVKFE